MPRSMLREVASRMPISIARKRIQKQDHANTRHVCSYKRSLTRVSLALSLSLTSFQTFPKFCKLKLRDTQRRLYLCVDHLTVRFIFRVNGCAFVTQRAENRCAKPLVRPNERFNATADPEWSKRSIFRKFRRLFAWERESAKYQVLIFLKCDSKMNKEVHKARVSCKIFILYFFPWKFPKFLRMYFRWFQWIFHLRFLHRFTIDSSDSWGSTNPGNITQR